MNYQKIKYPDGQISVKVNADLINYELLLINERINSYEDLFFIKSISDAARNIGVKNIILNIPCLFGQRSDLRFIYNQSFDLKNIAKFINSCKFDGVTIFDPHSSVSLALINKAVKVSSYIYVEKAVSLIKEKNEGDLVLVSPDAGAYKKVFDFGEKLNLPVEAAVKHRSLSGDVKLKFTGNVKDKVCLIVDDLCDGGYTFYLLSKALRERGATKVYLYVSHGYFSKGFVNLLESTDPNSSLVKSLDGIFCTNSVKNVTNDYTDGNINKSLGNFITQFKVI